MLFLKKELCDLLVNMEAVSPQTDIVKEKSLRCKSKKSGVIGKVPAAA